MMKRFVQILLASALAIVGSVSCHEVEKPSGSVVISFSTAAPVTRAGEVGDGNVADGGGIYVDDDSGNPDLFIAIANYSGDVIATYTGTNTANAELIDDATATQVSVRFKNITNSGEYTVFALANTSGVTWGVPSALDWTSSLTTASSLSNLKFNDLGEYGTLSVTDRMPLSAKGKLTISENLNGHVELEMLRCVGKVGFMFKNETGELLALTDCHVGIEEISPTQGYLFPRDEGTDTAGTARDLDLFSGSMDIGVDQTTPLYGMQLVFPSVAPERALGSRYFCNISFTVGGEPKTFSKLPIHDKMSRDIQALGRNQYLQITTRINKGLDISFNFEVIDWTNKREEIVFH